MSNPSNHLRGLPFVDLGDRQSGKTTRLIELAHKEGLVIVTYSYAEARRLGRVAFKTGKTIPTPISVNHLRTHRMSRGVPGYLFDEVGLMLQDLVPGGRVVGMTVSSSNPAPTEENS